MKKEMAVAATVVALGGGASLYQYLSQIRQGSKDEKPELSKLLQDVGQVKKLEELVRVLQKLGHHKAGDRVQAAADEWAEQAVAKKLEFKAQLDQQEKEKAVLVKDFNNRIRQHQKMNADLKHGSGKRDEECKVLKRTFEQYKVEASNKLKAKQKIISHMKQEAHASGTEMEQKLLQLQKENGTLRHKLEVREAAESSVVCQVQCQVAAAHQKLERQAAQHSSHLSEADAELQCEREARVTSETECDVVRLAAQQESHAALRAQHLWTSEKEALELRRKTRVGELEGEVRGLQESQAAQQATLATRLQESQLREQAKEAELKQSESAQAAALQEVRSGFQEELGRRIAEHTASQGDALQAVESHLQAERDMRTADSKVMQATIKALQQLVDDKGDELERIAGAKERADGNLKRSDSSLQQANNTIKALHVTLGEHSSSMKEAKAEAAEARSDRSKIGKALLERQESLDKKAKECSAVTRKAGALENSCAQLKGDKNALESQVHVLTAAQKSAPRQQTASKDARKRSNGASSSTSSAQQTEVPEAQLSLGSSEASPEDDKTPVVDTRATQSPKGASLDTLGAACSDSASLDASEVARSEAALSGSALSPDDATASSAGGESEGKGWTVVKSSRRLDRKTTNSSSSSRRLDRKTTNTGSSSRSMYHATSSKSTR